MRRPKRILSASQRADLWRRWTEGESLTDISRALDMKTGAVHGLLTARGGIPPAARQRNARVLSIAEREEISRGLSSGLSLRRIGIQIGRAVSTISREIKRNGGAGKYRAAVADQRAWKVARRPKLCKLATHARLQRIVAARLKLQWSPEQIAGWLREAFPDNEHMQISHETIYRSLFIQARGVLKKELQEQLRSRSVMRRSKNAGKSSGRQGQIVDAVSIRERPVEAEDRAVPGHWEGDLITGSRNTYIATLVERRSRFTILIKVNGKDSTSVVSALSKQVRKLPIELRRSLTWDRGLEMAQHKSFSVATNVQVYFCDPQSPWQRGTNENTNRLLRQYFPKGTELSRYSQSQLNGVAKRLNQRPRKTLGFRTPANMLRTVLL